MLNFDKIQTIKDKNYSLYFSFLKIMIVIIKNTNEIFEGAASKKLKNHLFGNLVYWIISSKISI
ncbi:hypothetical protein D1632_14520 [Chryseobacterium nematophagum]|uniref:Uncharacterized protein n=1 Tax=Chryseobacterium nematophagum TaxID=2305228 RepID=A0A3M7L7R1_9FLAO|nr:hypothetical protein D1632_14520 [Chryseobacterium nematophagum]